MIDGGNATLYVSDMDQAIDFYTRILGLRLRLRVDNSWAEVDAGPGLVIGLHPARPETPEPGTAGSVRLGLNVDGPLEDVVRTLTGRGVRFHGPILDQKGPRLAFFEDLDHNPIYLAEVKPEHHEVQSA